MKALAARGVANALVIVACMLVSGSALAQATGGPASSIVFPIAAKTSSFETEVFVRNPNSFPTDVDVLYYEANGLPSPGLKTCTMVSLIANSVVPFKLGTQCPSLASGGHFCMLVLPDHAAEKTHTFSAFSRVQHVVTNEGFSIEVLPEHTFSGRTSAVNGLKRVASAVPAYAGGAGLPAELLHRLARPSRRHHGHGTQRRCQLADRQRLAEPRFARAVSARPLPRHPRHRRRAGRRRAEFPRHVRQYVEPAGAGLSRVLHVAGQLRVRRRLPHRQVGRRGEHHEAPDALPGNQRRRVHDADGARRIFDSGCDDKASLLRVPAPSRLRPLRHRRSERRQSRDSASRAVSSGTTRWSRRGRRQRFKARSITRRDRGTPSSIRTASRRSEAWRSGPREGGGAPASFPVDYGYRCFSGSAMHGGGVATAVTDDF